LGQNDLGFEHRLTSAVQHLWKTAGTLDVPDEAIDELVDDWCAFLDSSTIALSITVPLLNFSGDHEIAAVTLPSGLFIMRLTDEQINRVYGGHPLMPRPSRGLVGPCEYAITGTITEEKIIGEWRPAANERNQLSEKLDRAILSLRTFKPFAIGYDQVHIRPVRFNPYLVVGSLGFGNSYTPYGHYPLAKAEVPLLEGHAAYFTNPLHSSLEAACTRLSDAAVRGQPRDKLLDAVIGLEAILLADPYTDDKDRGELRYRFAMNYSALQTAPSARRDAFRSAKKLYDCRSRVAHGGTLVPTRINGREMTGPEIAEYACTALKDVIARFLADGATPPYVDPDYWPGLYFA
jgi:hypothetical protein